MESLEYLIDLPIGAKFEIPNHRGVNTLTHKLGEGGYKGTTYPFRYTDANGIELTSTTNPQVYRIPKKGDSREYETCTGYKVTRTCIGFVVGIEYNSEGHIMEWLLNKQGNPTGYGESPKLFNTAEDAERYTRTKKDLFKTRYVYYRPYFRETFKKIKE